MEAAPVESAPMSPQDLLATANAALARANEIRAEAARKAEALREQAREVEAVGAADSAMLEAEETRCRRVAELLTEADRFDVEVAAAEEDQHVVQAEMGRAQAKVESLEQRRDALLGLYEGALRDMALATDVETEVAAQVKATSAKTLLDAVEFDLAGARQEATEALEKAQAVESKLADLRVAADRLRAAAEDVLSGEAERREAQEKVERVRLAAEAERERSAVVARQMLGLPTTPPGEPGQPLDAGWVGLPSSGGRSTWARVG